MRRPVRRRGATVLAGVLAVAGAAGLGAAKFADGGGRAGRLVVEQDVPDDVRAELDTTWARFVDRFAPRLTCVPDVSVLLVGHVDGGDARYVADRTRVEIEIPTTPARFRESLVHELGHHVERTCPAFADLRVAIRRATGLAADAAWSGGDRWEDSPSELWAETVVQLVNGERRLHGDTMPLDPAAVSLASDWAAGLDVSSSRADFGSET